MRHLTYSPTSISVEETIELRETCARLRLLAAKAQSLRWWAHEAAETVYAQTAHDEELQPSWLPELRAVIAEFDAVQKEIEGATEEGK